MDILYVVQKEIQAAQQTGRLNRKVLLSTLAYWETIPPPERPLPEDFDYDNFSVIFSLSSVVTFIPWLTLPVPRSINFFWKVTRAGQWDQGATIRAQ